MPTTMADALVRSTQKTEEWLHELQTRLGMTGDEQAPYRVLRGFLQTLRDRLSVDEMADFAAQLPVFLRGTFYEGWRPAETPHDYRDADTFLATFSDRAQLTSHDEPAEAARAVAAVVRNHVTSGQYEHVLDQLPPPVSSLLAVPRS